MRRYPTVWAGVLTVLEDDAYAPHFAQGHASHFRPYMVYSILHLMCNVLAQDQDLDGS